MKYEKIRKQVLEAILQAVEQGLINGTSGNIALRDDEDDVVAITPSGVAYGTMKPENGWMAHTNHHQKYQCIQRFLERGRM